MKAREVLMTKNMGTIDRLIRIILAVIIVILLLNGSVRHIRPDLSGTIFRTSAIGWCPLYKPMNINTKKTQQKQDS